VLRSVAACALAHELDRTVVVSTAVRCHLRLPACFHSATEQSQAILGAVGLTRPFWSLSV